MSLSKYFKKFAKAFIDAFTVPDEYVLSKPEVKMLEDHGYKVQRIAAPIIASPYYTGHVTTTCQVVRYQDGSELNKDDSEKVANLVKEYRQQPKTPQQPQSKPE